MDQKQSSQQQNESQLQDKQQNSQQNENENQIDSDQILNTLNAKKASVEELQLELFQNFLNESKRIQSGENFIKNVLIQLIEKKAVFTNILHFIKIEEDSIKINYSEKFFSVLSKIKKQLNLDESLSNNTKMQDTSDENVILQLLTHFTDKLVEGGLGYFSKHSVDPQKIKMQYQLSLQINKEAIKKCQLLKLIIQQIKILHSDLQEYEETVKAIKQQSSRAINDNYEFNPREDNSISRYSNNNYQLEKKEKQSKEKISIQNNNNQNDNNEYEMQHRENKIRREFAIKMFMLKLIEIQVVAPNILKSIKFLYFSKRHKIPDKRGILIVSPKPEIIVELCKMQELQKFAQQFNLDTVLFQNISPQVLENFENEYPNYFKVDLQYALVQYLQMTIKQYQKYQKELSDVYFDEDFKQLLQQIWNLCGDKIKLIFQNRLNIVEEFENYGCNILQVGTFLFKIKNLLGIQIEQQQIKLEQNDQWLLRNPSSKQDLEKPSSYTKPLFKHFIQKMIQLQKAFPLLLKLLHLTNFCVKVIPRKRVMTDIVQHSQFIKFMNLCYQYPIETKSIAERIQIVCVSDQFQITERVLQKWPQIILSALKLIYAQREQYKQVIIDAVQNKQYQTILKELDYMEEEIDVRKQTKELLTSLNDYVKEVQQEYQL